jgi:hypothetical protein
MRSRLILVAVVLVIAGSFSIAVEARIITAASSSLKDVMTASAAAGNGDTVIIPAGKSMWNGTLSVTKPITLKGAGGSATVLTKSGVMISCALRVDAPMRITGIGFENSTIDHSSLIIAGKKAKGANGPIRQLRIDHCRFVLGKRAIAANGWVEGVIDHNSFINCNIAIGITGDNDASWGRPIEPGSIHTICIEDNKFTIDNSARREPNQQIYLQEGGRATVRHNTFDSTAYTKGNGVFLDSHGNWPVKKRKDYNDPVQYRGQPLVEVYNNVFHAHHTYDFSDYRGGTIFVYNNRFIYDSGGKPNVFKLKEEEAWQTQLFNPTRTVWPAKDQIANSHFWGNTLNGERITKIDVNSAADELFIQEGRDYWQSPPSANTGSPPGKYFPYTPLIYPHPAVKSDKF